MAVQFHTSTSNMSDSSSSIHLSTSLCSDITRCFKFILHFLCLSPRINFFSKFFFFYWKRVFFNIWASGYSDFSHSLLEDRLLNICKYPILHTHTCVCVCACILVFLKNEYCIQTPLIAI